MGRYRTVITAASFLSVIGAILNLIGPSRLSEVTNLITDGMNSSIDLNAIGKIAVFLATLYIAGFAVNLITGMDHGGVTQKDHGAICVRIFPEKSTGCR
jgi:ATP-binding cassette subfamily B multidrug efflux pump